MNTARTTQASIQRTATGRRPLRAVLAAALVTCGGIALPMSAAASQVLAQKYSCVACHQPATKVVGPSWKDIRAKYGQGQGTAAQLAASIRAGSSGKWGAMPMPPQMQVPEADARVLGQWLVDGAK